MHANSITERPKKVEPLEMRIGVQEPSRSG
jgi:hypothetical protein